MRTAHFALVVWAAVQMAGCGIRIPMSPYLDEAGFNEPIFVEAQVGTLWDEEAGPTHNRDFAVVGFFLHEGILEIRAKTDPPWWEVAARGEPAPSDGTLRVLLGRREIMRHSQRRAWEENGTQFYSETITYRINVEQTFRTIGGRPLGPLTARVVLKNDPRDGQWQLESLTYSALDGSNGGEAEMIEREISNLAEGGGELARALERARAEASEIVSRDLAERGIIARSRSNPDVLESRSAGLAYYPWRTAAGDSTSRDNDLADAIRSAAAMCENLSTPPYEQWRLASVNDLVAVMTETGRRGYRSAQLAFSDTPDHRFWGALDSLSPEERADLEARQRRSNANLYYFIITTDTTTSDLYLSANHTMWLVGFRGGGLSEASNGWPRRQFKLVCVHDLVN